MALFGRKNEKITSLSWMYGGAGRVGGNGGQGPSSGGRSSHLTGACVFFCLFFGICFLFFVFVCFWLISLDTTVRHKTQFFLNR